MASCSKTIIFVQRALLRRKHQGGIKSGAWITTVVNGQRLLCEPAAHARATIIKQQQHARWKHAAKMGQYLRDLDEMAHRKEREAAEERRKKKKEKKAAKNKKKKSVGTSAGDDGEEDRPQKEEHGEKEDEEDDDSQTLPEPSDVKAKMLKVIDRFEGALKSVRGAEPTPELFDSIQVNAYGTYTPLSSVGQVVIVSPTLATVTCFDPSTGKAVRDAIRVALELNPELEDAGVVQVPLPKPNQETRNKTAKQLKGRAEQERTKIRKIRQRAMQALKPAKEGKLEGVAKDDAFQIAKEIETVTDQAIKNLNDMVDKKHDSIMSV